jgi:hypothetical protein
LCGASGGTITGGGIANQLAFWTSAAVIGGDPGLTYTTATDTLNLLGATASNLSLEDNQGDDFVAGTDATLRTPNRWRLSNGTAGTPVTGNSPVFSIYQVQNYNAASCPGGAVDIGCGGAFQVHAKNTAASTVQTVAIVGLATTLGTQDAVGVSGAAASSTAAKGSGGYFVGRRDGSTSTASGVELQVQNNHNSNCLNPPTGRGCVGALLAYNDRGFTLRTGGVAALAATANVVPWAVGFECQNTSSACFVDFSTSGARGVDLSGATYSTAAISLGTGATSGAIKWSGGATLFEVSPGVLNIGAGSFPGGPYTPAAGGAVQVLTTGSTVISADSAGPRTGMWSLYGTNTSNLDTVVLMIENIQRSGSPSTIRRTGLHVKSYTQPDNGGDTSGILVLSTGGGPAISAYKVSQLRPAGYTDYSNAQIGALEVGTADQAQAILAISGASGFGGPAYASNAVYALVDNSVSKGVLVTPSNANFDGRVAYAVGTQTLNGADTNIKFSVLMNGNISTVGALTVASLGTPGVNRKVCVNPAGGFFSVLNADPC